MAEKQTNKDRMREIVDSIENGIKELFESDKYRQYLSTMSRFHRYSVNNTMLIYMQRPDATYPTPRCGAAFFEQSHRFYGDLPTAPGCAGGAAFCQPRQSGRAA